MNAQTVTARNLWFNPSSAYSKRVFTYSSRCLFEYRGVKVYKNPSGSWDYILGEAAITQRAGFSKDRAPKIIDDILDGIEARSEEVAAHLRAHGFQGLSYAQLATAG